MPHVDTFADDWPISDYERGFSTSLRPHRQRYSEQPSMKCLMRDLRRPAARDDATQFLLACIDDVVLREWVLEKIRENRISRLTASARLGSTPGAVIRLWQDEMDAENCAVDSSKILDPTPVGLKE